MPNTKQELIDITRKSAVIHGIDPQLLLALCHHESAGLRWSAFRYEPAFYDKYVDAALKLHNPTEAHAQAISWGLGQVMGLVARELGFKGIDLSELLDPEVGTYWAAKKLKRCLSMKNQDIRLALLAYNGGSNPKYPDLVLAHFDKYPNLVS